MIRHSHIQPVELYAPLQALAYIRNHEAAEERRLLGGLSENLKLQNGTHKAEHGSQQSDRSEERSGKAPKNHSKARHTGKKGRQK